MKKNRSDLARGWVLKAGSDLADARRTISGDGPYDTACFHCQQAAEKFLKAFLAWHNCEIPKTHDIEEILLICSERNSRLKTLDFPAEEMSSYAVEMRYDFEFWPDRQTAKRALEEVERLWKVLKESLPPDITGGDKK